MSKYKAGDFVRFKEKEFSLPSVNGLSVRIDSDKFVGKITDVIELGPDGCRYRLEVNVHGVIWQLEVSEDQVVSLKDYVCDMMDVFAKKVAVGMREQTAKELSKLVDGLRKGPEISSRIIPTVNPDHNSWIKDMIAKWEKKHPSYDVFVDPKRYFIGLDIVVPSKPDLHDNLSPEMVEKMKKAADEAAAKKMPKEKCVSLLESYRAERAKVKAGRRFERCLRDSVVDEALERAIELLKEKA